LVKNAISIEGAVWEEAFFQEVPIAYTAATDPGHSITYTTDQLKRHSWSFWFQQSSHKATDVVGRFINSRTGADDALLIMKTWSATSTRSKYYRDNTTDYRTPNTNSLPEIVALMRITQRRPRNLGELPTSYGNTLTHPMGLTVVPSASDCDAVSLHWRNDQHSDMKNLPFYTIDDWFKNVFKAKTTMIK